MNCHVRRGVGASIALLLTAGAFIAPAAATTTVTTPVESPISHLGLAPGGSESEVNVNWFTASDVVEQVQIAPVSAMVGEVFPVEDASVFEASMVAGNDLGLSTGSATVSGLEAETGYVYRVGSDESGWSEVYEYSTEGFGDQFNFNFYGDAQLGSGGSGYGEGGGLQQDAQGWYDTLNTSMDMYPDASFLFHAGDQIDGYHDEGELEAWLGDRDPQYELFFAEEADVLREVPLAVLSGNHDDAGWTYDEYFNMPNETDRNYWYKHNNALVIGLDTNTMPIEESMALWAIEDPVEREAAVVQLQQDQKPEIIAAHQELAGYVNDVVAAQGGDADWIIVGFHQSPFSQAYHGQDDFDIQLMRSEGFTQALSDAGVDVVLGGHDHIYTRTHLLEGNDPVVPENGAGIGDEVTAYEGQTLYLTGNSSSGSKFYDYMDGHGEDDPQLADLDYPRETTAMWDQSYEASFSNIAIDGNSLTVKTHHTVDGALIDQVTITQTEQTTEPTPQEPTEEPTAQPTAEPSAAPTADGTPTASADPSEDPVTAAGGTSGPLVSTGAQVTALIMAGFALVAAGGGAMLWKRRQTQQ